MPQRTQTAAQLLDIPTMRVLITDLGITLIGYRPLRDPQRRSQLC